MPGDRVDRKILGIFPGMQIQVGQVLRQSGVIQTEAVPGAIQELAHPLQRIANNRCCREDASVTAHLFDAQRRNSHCQQTHNFYVHAGPRPYQVDLAALSVLYFNTFSLHRAAQPAQKRPIQFSERIRQALHIQDLSEQLGLVILQRLVHGSTHRIQVAQV